MSSKVELTTLDIIAIGKAALLLRFQAAYNANATEFARHEWRSTAETLADIECRCQPKPQPAEAPDEWVEITDPMHVLRSCDQLTATENVMKDDIVGEWEGCMSAEELGAVGRKLSESRHMRIRCRRRDLPKVEQAESDHVPDATKKISDESLELIVHLRDQMQVLANRVAECERVVFAQPQPQKTRVRLWIEGPTKMVMCRDKAPYGDWQELHHDSDGFYVENQR